MKKKQKYYLIGFVVLLVLIVGYHFLAASQAEDQIDKAIQEQSEKAEALSVQYSSIDVAPFSGTVSMRDLTFIFGNHIERAQHIQLDMGYLDFLNIYVGGVKYGLDHLDEATVTFIQPSYLNKTGLQELKLDTLRITYTGNALDGLQSAVNGSAFSKSQKLEANSSGLRLRLPGTTLNNIISENLSYTGTISSGKKNFWLNGSHDIMLDSLTWTPSKSFQDTYSFFIKGFGYSSDAIPFQYAELQSTPSSEMNVLSIQTSLKSELALLSSSGFIKLNTPLESSEFQKMNIRVTDYSESFSNVLNNIERLLSISLPKSNGDITLNIRGKITSPKIVK